MQFQFRTASQVVFGKGEHRRAASATLAIGRRVLLVTGVSSLAKRGVKQQIFATLQESSDHVEHVTVEGEPEVSLVDALTRQCKEAGCQVVLAIGGGSVIDVGKAVAALARNDGAGIEYLEDVGRGVPRAVQKEPLPVVAVPTTAGSGSEVTRNSVLKVPELKVKRSLRSELMIPKIAIVDPELVESAPQRVAASAAMDALTHLIEGYLSKGAQPLTDALALQGISLIWRALSDLADWYEAKTPSLGNQTWEHLALASLWGGVVLANAGLGAVHGLVAPLGGLCDVAHGDGCACLLPATFRVNAEALLRRQPHSPATQRLRELVVMLTGGQNDLDLALDRLDTLRRRLGIRSLSQQGVTSGQFAQIIASARGGSMRSNPIELSDQELATILEASLGA